MYPLFLAKKSALVNQVLPDSAWIWKDLIERAASYHIAVSLQNIVNVITRAMNGLTRLLQLSHAGACRNGDDCGLWLLPIEGKAPKAAELFGIVSYRGLEDGQCLGHGVCGSLESGAWIFGSRKNLSTRGIPYK